jgi:hypothetical protein
MMSDFMCDLVRLEQGFPGVSLAWGNLLAEAGKLCLGYHNHVPGVKLEVAGAIPAVVHLFWNTSLSQQQSCSWADEQEMTEFGACGVAILLMLELTGLAVVRRARKGTGVDYWLAPSDAAIPFQDAARLEVSGILNGGQSDIKARVSKKMRQTQGRLLWYCQTPQPANPYA